MDSVRIVQRSAHSSTVQVYNAQVIVKQMHRTYYQVECNINTAIGMIPCEKSPSHLCWHIKRAVERVLNLPCEWFERRTPALWMWAGNSAPMSLVHVESMRQQKAIAHGWAVVREMLSGMELAALESKGA